MTPKLSVVMVSASFHPYVGGAEKQALELSVALRRKGVDVRVLTRKLPGLAFFDGVRGVQVVRLPCAGSGLFNALSFMLTLWVYLLAKAKTYDAIHVHLAGSPALAAIAAGRLLGKKVVVKLGGGRGVGELSGSGGTLAGRLKLKLLHWLKPQFVAVTEDLAQELEAFGVRGAKLKFLPNGVDTTVYRPTTREEKKALRKKWGWPDGLMFLYVGRLSYEKRLPEFLKAWGGVFLKAPDHSAIAFVGAGPKEAEIRAETSGWPAGRFFLHPPTDEVWAAYAAADVFVLPSKSEGLSNALLEAMASGLGILASRVGGTAKILKDRENGLLFNPEDPRELLEKLQAVRYGPAMLEDLGRHAHQTVQDVYSIDRVAEKYLELYQEKP
jgi:glycosyltransferase involved in cell wall biosynthesis